MDTPPTIHDVLTQLELIAKVEITGPRAEEWVGQAAQIQTAHAVAIVAMELHHIRRTLETLTSIIAGGFSAQAVPDLTDNRRWLFEISPTLPPGE